MKCVRKIVFRMVTVLFLLAMYSLGAEAKENEILSYDDLQKFMVAEAEIEAKVEPREDADTAFTYAAGSTIYIMGETQEGWYIVLYQGNTGYINRASEEKGLSEVERDIEALDAEMQQEQTEGKMLVEEIERQRAEGKRSKIWGLIIVLLVAGIFATGLISTIQAEKAEKSTKEKKVQEHKGETLPVQKEDKQEDNDEGSKPEDEIWDLDKEQ